MRIENNLHLKKKKVCLCARGSPDLVWHAGAGVQVVVICLIGAENHAVVL